MGGPALKGVLFLLSVFSQAADVGVLGHTQSAAACWSGAGVFSAKGRLWLGSLGRRMRECRQAPGVLYGHVQTAEAPIVESLTWGMFSEFAFVGHAMSGRLAGPTRRQGLCTRPHVGVVLCLAGSDAGGQSAGGEVEMMRWEPKGEDAERSQRRRSLDGLDGARERSPRGRKSSPGDGRGGQEGGTSSSPEGGERNDEGGWDIVRRDGTMTSAASLPVKLERRRSMSLARLDPMSGPPLFASKSRDHPRASDDQLSGPPLFAAAAKAGGKEGGGRGKERSEASMVLSNLMAFQTLKDLLAALELYKDSPDGTVSAPQAVAAMNHLRRLGREGTGRSLITRGDDCMFAYSRVAVKGMWRLSGKHVALALNAVREGGVTGDALAKGGWRYQDLFSVAAKRILQLALVAKRGTGQGGEPVFDAQNSANIVNAYATAPVGEELRNIVFPVMADVVLSLGPFDYTAQAVANVLNAYAKVGMADKRMFDHLSLAALSMDASHFSPQHIANIVNAYSRAGFLDDVLFRHMSACAMSTRPKAYSLLACANILGAFTQAGMRDEALFRFLSDVVQGLPSASTLGVTGGASLLSLENFSAQAAANIVKAFSRADMADAALYTRLRGVILSIPQRAFDAEACTGIVNAYSRARAEDEALVRHIVGAGILLAYQGGGAVSHELTVKDMSGLLAAFSRCLGGSGGMGPVRYWINELFSAIAARLKEQDTDAFSVDEVACIVSAYARFEGGTGPQIFPFLSSVVQQVPADIFDAQSLGVISSAFLRAGVDDNALWTHLASAALAIDPSDYQATSVAFLSNAFAREMGRASRGPSRRPPRERGEPALANFDQSSFGVDGALRVGDLLTTDFLEPHPSREDLVVLAPAFRGVDLGAASDCAAGVRGESITDDELKSLSDYYLSSQPKTTSVTGDTATLFRHLAAAAISCPPSAFTPLTAALTANSFRQIRQDTGPGAHALFMHLGRAILDMQPSAFDGQNIANIANAFPRQPPRVADPVMSHMAQTVVAALPGTLGPQAVANILNGFSACGRSDPTVLARLKAETLAQPLSAWTAQEVVTSLQALAVLTWHDTEWLAYLSDATARHPSGAFVAEEMAMLGWSCAALRLDSPAVLRRVVDGVDAGLASMDRRSLRQVHQFLLSCRLDTVLSAAVPKRWLMIEELEGAKCRAAFEPLPSELRRSSLQRDVSASLAAMGVPFAEEVIEPTSGYSLDIVVTCGGNKVAIEVDGPFHFASGSRHELGSTVMKRRHLEWLGLPLVSIPYWVWDELQGDLNAKCQFLSTAIEDAGAGEILRNLIGTVAPRIPSKSPSSRAVSPSGRSASPTRSASPLGGREAFPSDASTRSASPSSPSAREASPSGGRAAPPSRQAAVNRSQGGDDEDESGMGHVNLDVMKPSDSK